MDIVLHVLGMPFNGKTLLTKSLGGSESAGYYLARELAGFGHKVTVFTSEQEEGIFDGVSYCFAGNISGEKPLGDRFEFYAQNTPHDVLIIQRHPYGFHKKFAAKICIHQMHDLALHRFNGLIHHGLWQTDAFTVVSNWHGDQFKEIYGTKSSAVCVIPNGVDPFYYEEIKTSEVVSKSDATIKMLYQSRPERGLMHLVRPDGIMDKLNQVAPGKFELFYCSYDNTTEQMAPFYNQLNGWADRLPNVTKLGALVKSELATVQMSCDVMCYPTEFEEVSCITAMEAMHAGLPFLSSAHGALPETCEDTGSILLPLIDGNADEEAFITQLLAFLDDPSLLKVLSIKQKESAVRFTWEAAAKKLEFLIHDLFDRRSTSTATVLRSAIEKADIIYAKHLIENYPEVEDSGIGKAAIKEIAEMYNFADSDEAYAAHYAKHQAAYYDGPGANVIGEDITSMPRFRGIASFIGELSDDPKKQLEIFDYGCAHGHFVISLAKMFPQHHFTGMDISDRAIGKAIEWAKRDNVPNVSFVIGTAKDIVEKNYYDVVSACEVLEHVPNPHAIMDILRSSMKDGGTFMATTPFGRWEWIGIEAYKTGREHLHHFERDDLREILKEFKHEIVCAPSGFDQGKAEIGSWVWSFIEDKSSSLSQINYARKTDTYAPRQTISACLIVKNGESTIVQCIKSFIDVVDEVIVMVDPLTTDRTIEVVQNLANDNPYKSFIIEMGLSALTDGFDEARNLSISKASGDWILWIDADEILHKGFNLHQLLKSSANDGYAMAQVHYAIEPAQVLTTDMPCRLFRNSIGVKFYGVVHEHPEVEIGKAVPHTMARHDVKFLHNGYTDEETRRARYNRNLPLLHRDLKKHPERTLTKFLMLRDISQGMSFELQANGGHKVPGFDEDAEMGINLFEDILENAPLRIAIDAVQYYSGCVDLLGGGFTMDINLETKKDEAKDLASNTAVSGRFLNKKHYFKLLERISTEAVKHYESKYL